MKVMPVSAMVTTPAETALFMAASDVSGVRVPWTKTLDARFKVPVPPLSNVPVMDSAAHDESPTVALGWL